MTERTPFNALPKGLYEALSQVQQYVDQSGLDTQLLELIQMRVSQINSCTYCLDMHFKKGRHAGLSVNKLIGVSAWRETPYYSEKEQAALQFAETLTHMRAEEHSDHIHDQLKKHFTQGEIAHLTLAIIQINSWNRLTRSIGAVPGNYKVPIEK